MDGASKFVRGDAMAGMLILFINIVGGFIIGMAAARHERRPGGAQLHPAGRRRRAGGADPGAADLGGRGDGGLARGQGQDIGTQIRGQVFDSPKALAHDGGHRRLLG
jgi:flagellar biosynthesis protein FlhA